MTHIRQVNGNTLHAQGACKRASNTPSNTMLLLLRCLGAGVGVLDWFELGKPAGVVVLKVFIKGELLTLKSLDFA